MRICRAVYVGTGVIYELTFLRIAGPLLSKKYVYLFDRKAVDLMSIEDMLKLSGEDDIHEWQKQIIQHYMTYKALELDPGYFKKLLRAGDIFDQYKIGEFNGMRICSIPGTPPGTIVVADERGGAKCFKVPSLLKLAAICDEIDAHDTNKEI